jgi:hypothetical protein
MTQAIDTRALTGPFVAVDEPEDTLGRHIHADHFGKGTATLERHPDDGWILARPVAMSRSMRRTLHAVIRALVPDGVDMPDAPERIEHHVRRLMRYMPWPVRMGLRFAILFLGQAPRLLGMSARSLRGLDVTRARAVLTRLAKSRITALQTLFYAVKGLVLSTFYDQDEAHAAIGYAPIPFLRDRQDLRRELLAGGAAQPHDHIAAMPGVRP